MRYLEDAMRDAEAALEHEDAPVDAATLGRVLGARATRRRRWHQARVGTGIAGAVAAVLFAGSGIVSLGEDPATTPSPPLSPLPTVSASPTPGVLQASPDPVPEGTPVMVPASRELALRYIDPQVGPTLSTGSMPPAAAYDDGEVCLSDPPERCEPPDAPPLTQAVLDTADESWALVMFALGNTKMRSEIEEAGGGFSPAGLYLVSPEGTAYFVAAGDPANGRLTDAYPQFLAWATVRGAAIMGGPAAHGESGRGFTLVDMLAGPATTVFPECTPIQAQAREDGWLVRAECPDGSVAAVIDDTGALVTTDGLLVADNGVAVGVGADFLVSVAPQNWDLNQYYYIVDGVASHLPGTSCWTTDMGRAVRCDEGTTSTYATLTEAGVATVDESSSIRVPSTVDQCTLGDIAVRVTVSAAGYTVTRDAPDGTTVLAPDPVDPHAALECTAAGNGFAYLSGAGGLWSVDTATGEIQAIFAAPSETYPVTEDWPIEAARVVGARAIVGTSGFLAPVF